MRKIERSPEAGSAAAPQAPARLYTCYPCGADGKPLILKSMAFSCDDDAINWGEYVLATHTGAVSAIVWCGPRKVITRRRDQVVRRR